MAVLLGLTELDMACAEAELVFAFLPNLHAVLAVGLPTGTGFLD